jgi:L-fuculose-phosphate aldolase
MIMAYTTETAKELVAKAGHELLASGLIVRTWGNISARLSDTQFAITPSGRGYEKLTAEDIIVVNIADLSYEGEVKPSSEMAMHAAIYRQRPDVNFIVHTHQRFASAISVLGETLDVEKIDASAAVVTGAEVPTAEYAVSSSKPLADEVEKAVIAFPKCNAVLMRGHGVACMGTDDTSAFQIAETLERVAETRYREVAGKLMPEECDREYCDSDYYRVVERGTDDESKYSAVFSDDSINCVIETATPFIRKISSFGAPMMVSIDDLAQMVGPDVPCLPADASDADIKKVLQGTNGGVLLEGREAVCTGRSVDDAEAVCMVMEKNAMGALLGKTGRKIFAVDRDTCEFEHSVYVNKYSKLK